MLQSKAKWKSNRITNIEDQWMDDSTLSPIVKELLLQRGIASGEAARQFLSPDISTLHNPAELDSIDVAAARVHQAIEQQEKILVYGDYDADGVSSTTVLLLALKELGAECDYYIPNRFTEGYGPNEAAFREIKAQGYTLVITVDNGIAAVHEASIAKEIGLDLIITDHHEVQDELPDAYAIIHPKRSTANIFSELAGVGVAFKFAEYLLGYFPKQFLSFVAIGTIADLVPLISENRVLAYHGLRALSQTDNIGLQALMRVCKIEGDVSEEDVGFLIGPRINAVGRLQDADLAVQLLMTEDIMEAEEIATEIDQINVKRQQIVNDIVKEAEKMVDPNQEKGVIIVAKEGWNEGVLGIVASKLVRKFDQPAIVLTKKPETSQVKGSARSIPAFDLFKNCMTVRDLFTHFGGHSQAAGMTLPLENLEELQIRLNELIRNELTESDFKQLLEISSEVNILDVNEKLVDEIGKLAPFGMKNPKPIFQLTSIPSELRQIGSTKRHLKLLFKEDGKNLEGIGFGFGELFPHISPNTPVTIVGELGINEWNGIRKPQIVLQDMEIKQWQLFDHRGRKNINLTPYIEHHNSNLVVGNPRIDLGSEVQYIQYDAMEEVPATDALYIYEMPKDLSKLKELIQKAKPQNIHACYYIENSAFLNALPSREDFKWYYAVLLKKKILDLNTDINVIMNAKGWNKERIFFISEVFFELGFVKIDNGVITVNSKPAKKDLLESTAYQAQLEQAEIEKTLYYSNYNELRNWFNNCMDHVESPKEELSYGL
ncbi:single-stranded-DNA-specific exonuclease RecJ [Oceanobacillus manasiensis]|uniref:single-stranded-DNA-specific exonuclease RecJ n=1 Tax=Oceanobacillus manasiensis TaxID=586413 RepID=UPI0005A6CCA5|nr:single-stranded-DNA-specific exonuclease RecJ [Oceanobacillus manasiensis]